jgi:RHS repeat-associated protein
MERDEESGMGYHTARFYLAWTSRWASADPIGAQGGVNLYQYVAANPISNSDSNGTQPSGSSPPSHLSLLEGDPPKNGVTFDSSKVSLLGAGSNPLDVVKNPALFLLTLGQMRESVRNMPLIPGPTEAEMRDILIRSGPQLSAGPSASDAVMNSSLFPKYQMQLMYEAAQVPLLGAALPSAAAGLGAFAVGSGYYELSQGNYGAAKARFLFGIALLGSSTAGFELSSMRTATANANKLQATLEMEVFGNKGRPGMFSARLQSESVIATGVMRTQNGQLLTTVTVNQGFRSKIARELSMLAEKHSAVFVSGTSHAERNLISFASEMNFGIAGMPIIASSPVCELCATAGHDAGVVFQNNLRPWRFNTVGSKATRIGGYVAPDGAPLSPHASEWIDKYTLFPGL